MIFDITTDNRTYHVNASSHAEAQQAAYEAANMADTAEFLYTVGQAVSIVLYSVMGFIGIILWSYVLVMDYAWIQLSLVPFIVLLQVVGTRYFQRDRKLIGFGIGFRNGHPEVIENRIAISNRTKNSINAFFRMDYLRPMSERFTPFYYSLPKMGRALVTVVAIVISVLSLYAATVYNSHRMDISQYASVYVPALADGEGPELYSAPLWFGKHQGKVTGRLPAGEKVRIEGITRVPLCNYPLLLIGGGQWFVESSKFVMGKGMKLSEADKAEGSRMVNDFRNKWYLPKRQFKIVTSNGMSGYADAVYFSPETWDRVFAPRSLLVPFYAALGTRYLDIDGNTPGGKIINDNSIWIRTGLNALLYFGIVAALLILGSLAAYLLGKKHIWVDASGTESGTDDEEGRKKGSIPLAIFIGLVCAALGAPLIAALAGSGGALSFKAGAIGALVCFALGVFSWRISWIWMKCVLLWVCASGFATIVPLTEKGVSFSRPPITAYMVPGKASAVTIQDVNLRAESSGGAALVKTIKKGETLKVTGAVQSGWVPVEHGGDTGWVSAQYLKMAE